MNRTGIPSLNVPTTTWVHRVSVHVSVSSTPIILGEGNENFL